MRMLQLSGGDQVLSNVGRSAGHCADERAGNLCKLSVLCCQMMKASVRGYLGERCIVSYADASVGCFLRAYAAVMVELCGSH